MDTFTVAALDVITAFAVPNVSGFSQSRRVFAVWLPSELPHRAGHSVYFGLAPGYVANPFDRRLKNQQPWSVIYVTADSVDMLSVLCDQGLFKCLSASAKLDFGSVFSTGDGQHPGTSRKTGKK